MIINKFSVLEKCLKKVVYFSLELLSRYHIQNVTICIFTIHFHKTSQFILHPEHNLKIQYYSTFIINHRQFHR